MRLFKRNYPALQKTVFVLIAFLGVTYIYYTWRSTEENKFDQTRLIARSFVASLPIDDLKVLEALPGDIDRPQYQVIKNALKELISINTTARFAYIFIERKGKRYFIADSEPKESKDYSPPGQEYSEFDLSFEQLFKDGKEYIKVHATDRWGTWTTVLVPVKDKVTGKTIAVFGIDFNAKWWFNSILIEVTESSVLILLMLLTLVLLYLIKTKNEILNDNITKLLQAADELKKQKEEFEMIFNLVPAQIWYKDTHNRFIRVNRQVCTDLGLTENEITDHSAEEIFPSFAQKYFDDDLEVFNSGIPKLDIIQQINTSAGELKWVHTDKFPVFGNDNELMGLVAFTLDITERKKSEDALQKSEAQLRTLVQTIPDLIWLKDNDGVYLQCNTMFEHFFGARETDIMGKTDYDFIDKDLADFFRDHDRKAMAAGKPTANEEWITFADDGHRAYLDTIKAPLYDSLGTLIGVMGIGRDISEHKKAEDALKASEEKYRTIFENVQDVFYQITLSGIINEISPSIKNFAELSREEIIGTSVYNFYNKPEERAFFLDAIMKNGEIRDYEIEFKTKTGKIKSVSVNASLIFDAEAKPSHIDGALRDVTNHKRAEEEISMLAYSLKSISECVCITDLDDKILFVNESFSKTYGYDINELIGNQISIVHSKNNVQEIVHKILPATINGGWKGQLFNKRKDGSEFPIRLSTSVIKDKNGKSIGLISVAKDITEHKKAEKELIEAKNKAEESDRLKSAFLANMSHEIRTPMNGILGFAGLLKEPMLSGEEQMEYIDIIEQSGNRMLNIINDIVSISKVESGQMEVSIKETNINEQIEYIYTFFRPEAEKNGIKLNVKNSLPSKKTIIKSDREKIYAILTNLVKNALKFTQTGTIEFGYSPKTKGESSELEFYVKDTGIGINPEHQNFIFERFRQSNDSLNRNYEGAGLGLAISKAYVEMLGGRIWVESVEGKGSTFYFTIPVNTEPEERIVVENIIKADVEESQMKKLKILIVEDEEVNLKLITVTVKKFCNKILKAKTGIEAVEACRNNPDIDLIFMDIKMPEMDGYEATRKIRQFNTEVIIIAQTAFALIGDREKALAAGCNDYISKPIRKDKLKELIQQYFKK